MASYTFANRRDVSVRFVIAGVLAVWLASVFLLGAAGAFVAPPGAPPLPILIGVTAPLIVVVAAYRSSAVVRGFVLSMDLSLATGIQAWRAGGLVFLAMYAYGLLPGSFAWPAGLGDIAIGVTAPWVALALGRRPGFRSSRAFVVWNLLGILDLVVALSTGALGSLLASGIGPEVTTAPMAQLPLVLIPAYLVPVFIMLHLAALFQAHKRSARDQES
jgi:hypothetical protein